MGLGMATIPCSGYLGLGFQDPSSRKQVRHMLFGGNVWKPEQPSLILLFFDGLRQFPHPWSLSVCGGYVVGQTRSQLLPGPQKYVEQLSVVLF